MPELPQYAQAARDYLRQNFEAYDRIAVVTIKRGTERDQVTQTIMPAREWGDERNLARLGAANAHGANIYVSMNTIATGRNGRTKEDIGEIRHLYLDIDKDGQQALQRVLRAPELPKPHHVLESSPQRYQVIWQVEGFSKQEAESRLRGMTRQYSTDIVITDSARILRIPGFRNWNHEAKHYVRDIQPGNIAHTYRPEAFPKYEQERAAPVAGRVWTPSPDSRDSSESGRDWGLAKAALKEGRSPGAVVESIIDRRVAIADAGGKAKPNLERYAEGTVRRALEAISHESSVPREATPSHSMERSR
jgi:hypothetical protein